MKAVAESSAGESAERAVGATELEIDDYDLARFLAVAGRFGTGAYGYVVTPNVDHMIRYREDARFRALYRGADYVLLDSRVAASLYRMVQGIRAPVCTGSDLTAALFEKVIAPSDHVVLIGASERQAALLRTRFGLTALRHYNPPMGFIDDAAEVEKCLAFAEAGGPFRFCLIAVGSPRQEILACRLAQRGQARGLALCIGAAIDFLTGAERRAPAWMRRVGLEWLYRLWRNPRRLAWRYLVRGPKFFAYVGTSKLRLRPVRAGD